MWGTERERESGDDERLRVDDSKLSASEMGGGYNGSDLCVFAAEYNKKEKQDEYVRNPYDDPR